MRFGNSATAGGGISRNMYAGRADALSGAPVSLPACTASAEAGPIHNSYEIRSEYSEVFFLAQRSFRSCSSARQSTRVNT